MPDPMIIFDDGHGQLGPMTDLRASFEVRTGMFTTAGRLAAHKPRMSAGYWVDESMLDIVRERADAPVNMLPSDEIIYCVNGRWGMPDPDLKLEVGEALVERSTEHVVAAMLRRADAQYFLETGQLHERVSVRQHKLRLLYRYPWDVIALMKQTIATDILSTRVLDAKVLRNEAAIVGEHPVEVAGNATLFPGVVLDVTEGPIMIHEDAVVRPGAVICGPCSVGPSSVVMENAILRPFTVIGRACKVGGEIGSTIFQGFANKGHHGYVGDSWIGRWANLGAGTTTSNLMNTYGEVKMQIEPDEPAHRTGMMYLGSIIGDHVKLGINTSLTTGCVIGTGALVAVPAPPKVVPRFAWLTPDRADTWIFDRFYDTMERVLARRKREPSAATTAALRSLHKRVTAPTPEPAG